MKNEIITKAKNGEIILAKDTEWLIEYYNKEIKKLEVERSKLYEKLQKEMEKNNILKIETERTSVSYVGETDVEYFNKSDFKKENRDLYNKYSSIRKKAPYLRISIKGKNDNEDN